MNIYKWESYPLKYKGNSFLNCLNLFRFNVGVFENIGSRTTMEDTYIIC